MAWLDAALPADGAVALDAGCGHRSLLSAFRPRIARLAGTDLHPPEQPLEWVDEFRVADLCRDSDAFPPGTFDVVLCAFALEHLDDPLAALRTIGPWLRPGGWLLVSTVNRRNPLVATYLSLPAALSRPLQRRVKRRPAEAHPLVGRCNTPRELRAALCAAGYEEIALVTTTHLQRAWRRFLPARLLGAAGDLVTRDRPARRSTLVARGRRATAPPS
jgi:2-polyprenyl-3-methyl-5-hydroxy-6-metoxy-1,4-benzoquinol methylase